MTSKRKFEETSITLLRGWLIVFVFTGLSALGAMLIGWTLGGWI